MFKLSINSYVAAEQWHLTTPTGKKKGDGHDIFFGSRHFHRFMNAMGRFKIGAIEMAIEDNVKYDEMTGEKTVSTFSQGDLVSTRINYVCTFLVYCLNMVYTMCILSFYVVITWLV